MKHNYVARREDLIVQKFLKWINVFSIYNLKLTGYYVFLLDFNIVISIGAVLFVPKTNQMPQFMDHNTMVRASSSKGSGLSTTNSANIRVTTSMEE